MRKRDTGVDTVEALEEQAAAENENKAELQPETETSAEK